MEIKEAAALEAVRQSLGALDTAAERLARCDRLHEALQSWRGATRRHRRRIAGGTGRVKGRKPPADGVSHDDVSRGNLFLSLSLSLTHIHIYIYKISPASSGVHRSQSAPGI